MLLLLLLANDGLIVIYGGGSGNGGQPVPASTPQLAVLDTNSAPYKWTAQQSNGTNVPPPLIFHSAELVGNYMVITFGN